MENENILGCFVSSMMGEVNGSIFRDYIWGDKGICKTLKQLKSKDYGQDLLLILFQFYVNPIPYLLQNLKEIENYRKKEKSIGIPIIINDDNFFCKTEDEKYEFLKKSILYKLDILENVIVKKKLDTKLNLLKSDLIKHLYSDNI